MLSAGGTCCASSGGEASLLESVLRGVGTPRGLGMTRQAKFLLHHLPSRIVPQHWGGKEQGINAIQHPSVPGKKRS
jgi:hypothetical protein